MSWEEEFQKKRTKFMKDNNMKYSHNVCKQLIFYFFGEYKHYITSWTVEVTYTTLPTGQLLVQ